MLLKFNFTNFRSFKDYQSFSMVTGKERYRIANNTFAPHIKGFDSRVLRSSSIHGANASGKTNLLRALQFMKDFVILAPENRPLSAIQNNTFRFSSEKRVSSTGFDVFFIQNGVRYEYGFYVSPDRVEREWLNEFQHARSRSLFQRKYDSNLGTYEWKFSSFFKGHKSLWSSLTRPDVLFLPTAVQLNSEQLLPVYEWFQKRLVIIFSGTFGFNQALTLQLLEEESGKQKIVSLMQEAGFDINGIKVRREVLPPGFSVLGNQIIEHKQGQHPNLVIVTLDHPSDDPSYSGIELGEESQGTQVFFRNIGAWFNVFKNGVVLLIDEIESSLHSLLVKFLIEKFHKDESNPHNAQLIFTTHSTDLLDDDIFRQDQVWFCEKDKEGASRLYPLSSFNPRSDASLRRSYLKGAYGALPILEKKQDQKEKDKNP